jgi:hypothetical protein
VITADRERDAADGLATPAEFRAAQVEACRWLREHTGYSPGRFHAAVATMDGDEALAFSRRLIVGSVPYGFERLDQVGQLWWSLEAAALRERWRHLFGPLELAAARWRLRGAGITDPDAFANGPQPTAPITEETTAP